MTGAAMLLSGCGGIRFCEAPTFDLSKLECLRAGGNGPGYTLGILHTYAREQSPEPTDDFGCEFEINEAEGTLTFIPTGSVCAYPNQGLDVDRAWVTQVCKRPPRGVWLTSHGTRAMRVTVTDAEVTCELL